MNVDDFGFPACFVFWGSCYSSAFGLQHKSEQQSYHHSLENEKPSTTTAAFQHTQRHTTRVQNRPHTRKGVFQEYNARAASNRQIKEIPGDICACLTITSLCHTPRREPRPPADAHTNEISPNPGKRSRLQSKTRKAQTLAPQTSPCYGCRPRHSHRTRCRRPPATRRNTTSTPQPAAAGE